MFSQVGERNFPLLELVGRKEGKKEGRNGLVRHKHKKYNPSYRILGTL